MMGLLDAAASAVAGALDAGNTPDVKPGTVAAWAVTFHRDTPGALGEALLTVGSDSYDGSVAATLPREATGGTYQVVVEGMTDEDYALIRLPEGEPLAARIHLWWSDSAPGLLGDLAQFTGFTDPLGPVTPKPPEHSLVAEIRVETLRRRAGERRYEAVVTGRERLVARLAGARVQGLCYENLDAAVQAVAKAAGITVRTYGLAEAVPDPDDPNFAATAPGKASDAMTALVGQARDSLHLYGMPVAIIRDGTLHVGNWLPVVAERALDEGGGLVGVERGPVQPRDLGAGAKPPSAPASRPTVTLTALGRPDIKPGDVASAVLPPEDFPVLEPTSLGAAVLTAVTGLVPGGIDPPAEPTRCRVTDVTHRISRRQGFVTIAQAVVLAEGDHGWDAMLPDEPVPPAREGRPKGAVATDTAVSAATAVQGIVRDTFGAVSEQTRARIAQVRAHPASGVPRHTSDVWYDDRAPDGKPAAAQRVTVDPRHHGELREVPYLSPFAWGNYGIVLPRYPGTRVLLVDGGGGPGGLVDAGAVWSRDAGPPAEPGDFWLVLPVGVTSREQIEGDGQPGDGPATHDLIDGDGTRVIETKRFVIRVIDDLPTSTDRPDPGEDAPEGCVLIEARNTNALKQAQILLKDDGSITLTGSSISLDAGTGNIALKGSNVTVKVSGTMDVGG
jgi:hypothetical protein